MFVFFKQKTAYEMRISDWSSDVCSSDLQGTGAGDRGLLLWAVQATLAARRAETLVVAYGRARCECGDGVDADHHDVGRSRYLRRLGFVQLRDAEQPALSDAVPPRPARLLGASDAACAGRPAPPGRHAPGGFFPPGPAAPAPP